MLKSCGSGGSMAGFVEAGGYRATQTELPLSLLPVSTSELLVVIYSRSNHVRV